MNTYQLTPENKAQEKVIINQILTSNGYKQHTTHQKHKQNTTDTTQKQNGQLSHIMAQILGPSPNCSATLI
jgi:hypothetical protein